MAELNFFRNDGVLVKSLGGKVAAPFSASQAHHLIPVEAFSANNKATPRTDKQKTAVSAITEGFSAYEAGSRGVTSRASSWSRVSSLWFNEEIIALNAHG